MIPSKFGMAPLSAGSITHHHKFTEPTSTMFAQPNNSKSNQKYISLLARTADPIIPIQIEREDKMISSAIPKICVVSFYPQGNEFFILPIASYFIRNPVSSIPSYFVVPEEPCNIYFECEDPNKLLQYLKIIPELSDLNLSPHIIANTSTFVQLFCNFNTYCHLQSGNFVQVSDPEFDGDFAQIVSVDKENKKCLLKLIPRIDYDNLAKYHLATQTQLNDLMPVTYKPPKALFDEEKLTQINSNSEFGSKKINIDKTTEIQLTVWSGKKFYGKFQYKFFSFETIKTVVPKISLDELEIFRKNIYLNEKFIRGFVEACEHLYSDLSNSANSSSNILELEDDVENTKNQVEKEASTSIPILRVQRKKKNFFPISSLNDLTKLENKNETKTESKKVSKTEDKTESKKSSKTEEKIESKKSSKTEDKIESKKSSKTEDKIESKKSSKTEDKIESKKVSKKETKSEEKNDNSNITPGTRVFPQYGQYADILFKVKTNDGKIITAEAEDSYMSVPCQDFSLTELYQEKSKETFDISVQVTPPPKLPESPKQEITKSKAKKASHKSKNKTKKTGPLFDVLGNSDDISSEIKKEERQYVSIDSQTELGNYVIPRENDMIELENGKTAMIVDDSNYLLSLAAAKTKIKSSEILQSRVISDASGAVDSKGDRLSVNEEVKIIKGRNSGEFARICHISSDSLFVKLSNEIVSIQPDYTRKLQEDAQKVEAEDVIGENILLLKNNEMSKPMRILRFEEGTIHVENIHDDNIVKNHYFTVKLKDYRVKWMFETDIPVEMRYKGSPTGRKTKKKGSHK